MFDILCFIHDHKGLVILRAHSLALDVGLNKKIDFMWHFSVFYSVICWNMRSTTEIDMTLSRESHTVA